jgi:hypothetical protein
MGASQIPAASGGSSAPPSDNWAHFHPYRLKLN